MKLQKYFRFPTCKYQFQLSLGIPNESVGMLLHYLYLWKQGKEIYKLFFKDDTLSTEGQRLS